MHDTKHAMEPLQALARNLRWAWQPEVQRLFRELHAEKLREVRHNPLALLSVLGQPDPSDAEPARALHQELEDYLADEQTWADGLAPMLRPRPVAYFSAEFGIHESLPIYSGGLGVLAGDHLKSASDLGVPLVGVGLFYSQGYFVQRIDAAGMQHQSYPPTDRDSLPMELVCGPDGSPLTVTVETRDQPIHAKVWKLLVGRVPLYLLDSHVPANHPSDRSLTARLYAGDRRMRIRQEVLLGVGGLRALRAVGVDPSVLHLNEGHSAFAALERARMHMDEEGLTFGEAAERVISHTVFTTHTPVPAGHDRFRPELVEEHLGPLRDALGLSEAELLALGEQPGPDGGCAPDPMEPSDGSSESDAIARAAEEAAETFCMTVLALKLSQRVNGVSALHGDVSRRMWRDLWPDRPTHEVPIGHITNGVHTPTWLAPAMGDLFGRHFGADWLSRQADPATWAAIDTVDGEQLWSTHQGLKRDLIDFVRRRSADDAMRRGESAEVVARCRGVLREDALLIGFARRFATYKRATLVLEDLDVLDRLVNHPDRPIQLVFAGKAHPRDEGGKKLIQRIHETTRDPRFAEKVVFLENYDMEIGRRLVQGVDVWLNNPRRPLEASGTSGQKAVLNGGLNCSVLDGWWAEGWDGLNGFAIGSDRVHTDPAIQDRRDSESLLRTLRTQVAPLYYRRDGDLPGEWVQHMKRSIRTLAWRFNSDRMVMDYARECYVPAAGFSPCVVG